MSEKTTETTQETKIPNQSFTLQQMKEQGGVLYNVIQEIQPILNEESSSDTEKLTKICNLIGMMYGTADFTIKKMMEENKESITAKEIIDYGNEYIEFFKEARKKKLEELEKEEKENKSEEK